MINYTITRHEAKRNEESGLLTHIIVGLKATDDQDANPNTNSSYREAKIDINEPVESLNPDIIESTKATFQASVTAEMEAEIAQKQAIED